ncbi:hypothetical protein IVB38_01020 [Bradyrhizobium sp. 38]|uniref:hypothetical protein n=1 Tax=unclassified Bradyrhizobium TaxID=2631580 RepID=UPI001FF79EC5|nr:MULTISPECIES: hypothetical protein [unclassified Bradyrhizobium]MCK1334661.1 hypothetical protein [Bradyrhizobium sp. 38]
MSGLAPTAVVLNVASIFAYGLIGDVGSVPLVAPQSGNKQSVSAADVSAVTGSSILDGHRAMALACDPSYK